jgi:tol-pal system protein YbgF
MRIAAAALALVLVACATNKDVERPPSLVPPPDPNAVAATSNDPRVDELQTSMTELLERIDVLNARIAKLESGTPASAPAGPAASPPPAPAPIPVTTVVAPKPLAQAPLRSANLADDYRNALMLFGKSHWADARAAFQRVFDADPSGDLADNALFWIGETYYAAGDYANAMRYYERVTKEYGEANKAPDAMLKMGLAFAKSGDLAMAHKAFDDCIRRYPYSTAAASAKLELKRIKY